MLNFALFVITKNSKTKHIYTIIHNNTVKISLAYYWVGSCFVFLFVCFLAWQDKLSCMNMEGIDSTAFFLMCSFKKKLKMKGNSALN